MPSARLRVAAAPTLRERVIMSFESWSLKKRLTLTFAAILVLAGVLFTVAVVNIGKMREATKWNTHTYKVLDAGQSMLLDMVNIETGLRGFVASGDEKFLEPLKAGEANFQTDHQEAKRLTSDNAEQQARLDKLMVNHQQFMAVASSLMKLRRDVAAGASTLDELVTSFGAGRDKASMDAFRAGIAEFASADCALVEVAFAVGDHGDDAGEILAATQKKFEAEQVTLKNIAAGTHDTTWVDAGTRRQGAARHHPRVDRGLARVPLGAR